MAKFVKTSAAATTATASTNASSKSVPYEEFWSNDLSREGSYQMFAKSCDYSGELSLLQEWAQIQRLKPSCQVYQDIVQYVNNSCTGKLEVQQIYRVDRKDERPPFADALRIMLWHGTKPDCIPGILQKGLIKGTWGLYGPAIYLADRIAESQNYTEATTEDSSLFILAEVAPGNIYRANEWNKDFTTAPQGYDSVKGLGMRTPTWEESTYLHGAILPYGKTFEKDCQCPGNYSEYVIYSPDRVIVRYIVECR